MKTKTRRLAHGRGVILAAILAASFAASLPAQQFAVGADVSFLADAEQKGIVFKEDGVPKPVLEILKDHGYNWIRLRVFVHPTDLPNDLDYTIALAKRARLLGFRILLDFHYSDTWADPGKQFIPVAWKSLKHKQLVDQVFAYTRDTIAAFRDAGVMPDMVQTGNEITNGMLWPDGKLPDNWDHFADLLRAAIGGVDAGRGSLPRPVMMIQIERSGAPKEAIAFFDKLLTYDLPWNVIGLSYYPRWHGTIEDLGRRFTTCRSAMEGQSLSSRRRTTGRREISLARRRTFPKVHKGRRIFCKRWIRQFAKRPGVLDAACSGGSRPLRTARSRDERSSTTNTMLCLP
jgi:arabinogalactan endo-1,4-beta-galactosidase